jgi:hypothetical protein
MSNPISSDCSSGLHDYCTPCECACHKKEATTLRTRVEALPRISHNGDAEMVLEPRDGLPLDEYFVRLSDVLALIPTEDA